MQISRPPLKIVATASGGQLADRDDDTLMLLASSDRTDAFVLLVERHMKRLANLCSRLVCDPQVGEEIAQESWLQIWAARRTYRPDGRFTVYLYTVARNRCRNHRRDSGRHARWFASEPAGTLLLVATAEPEGGGPIDALIEQERRHRVNQAIARLPEALREALLFRFSEGLDYADIARIIGRYESTIRSRVYLAVERLREELGRGEKA